MFWKFLLLLPLWGHQLSRGQDLPLLRDLPRAIETDPGQDLKNQQEVNYTKALVAYNKNDLGHAFSFLVKNLGADRPPHAETLELLSMVHEKRKDYLKAIRAQYYLIKKFSGDEILKARGLEETEKRLKEREKENGPLSEKVLGQYFKLADLYTKLYQKQVSENKKGQEHIHQTAFKYFFVCRFHHYRPEQVNYALGMLYRSSGQPQKASEHLREARDQLTQIKEEHIRTQEAQGIEYAPENEEKDELADIEEFRGHINLYLSDSFLSMGNPDLSLNYIRSTADQDLSPGIKNMARLYFDSLSQDYLVLNAAYGYGHDNNVFGLNKIQKSTFNENAEYYGQQEGLYDNKLFSAFYNSKNFRSKSVVLAFQANEILYKENELLSRADFRSYYGAAEFKHFREDSAGVLRLSTSVFSSFVRRAPKGAFSYDGSLSTITPLSDFWSKYGSLSVGTPLKFNTNQNTNGQSREYGLSLGFTPWGISPLLSPSASMSMTRLDGGGLSSDARKYLFSLTNLAQMGDFLSLYASFIYALDNADALENRVDVFNSNISAIWSLRKLVPGLIFRLTWDETLSRTGEHYSDRTHRRLLSSTLNLSF